MHLAIRASEWQRAVLGKTDNLVTLPDLNEDILLDELKARYRNDDIYVRTVARKRYSYKYVPGVTF